MSSDRLSWPLLRMIAVIPFGGLLRTFLAAIPLLPGRPPVPAAQAELATSGRTS